MSSASRSPHPFRADVAAGPLTADITPGDLLAIKTHNALVLGQNLSPDAARIARTAAVIAKAFSRSYGRRQADEFYRFVSSHLRTQETAARNRKKGPMTK